MTPRLHPVTRYADARAAIAFLERAFGVTRRAVHDGPDGSVAHAELSLGTGTIGVSSAGPVDVTNVWTTVREGLYASVPDPDAHCRRATAAGARIERHPFDTGYGSRDYTASDPDGRLWGFGTYAMSDASGPPTFIPEIRAADATAMVAFLTSAFGLEPGLLVRDAAGCLVHAELWLDDSPLFVATGGAGQEWWRGRTQCTHVVVSDPDAHHRRAVEAGATIVTAPKTTSYGARGYLAEDTEGFLWGFSTYRPARG